MAKKRPKSSSPRSEPPPAEFKREARIIETPEEAAVQTNPLPKVMLCDVAKKCDACSHNCGYVLPHLLKAKVVRCFKQEMKAGLHILPSCSGHSKVENVKSALIKNHKHSSSLKKKSINNPHSVTGHQKHLGDSDLQGSQSPAERFHSGSTETSAAFLADNQKDCRSDMSVESEPVHRDNKMKLGGGAGCSSTFSPALEENGELMEPSGDHTSSDLFSENDVEDTDDPESFTCQRVKAYFGKISYSCARTYMSWPFLNSHPTRPAQGSTSAPSAGPGDLSAGPGDLSAADNSVMTNLNQACSASDQEKDTLQDPSLEKQNHLAENGETFGNHSSYMNVCVCSVQPEDSPPSPQSSPSVRRRQPGLDAASALKPLPVMGAETDIPSSSVLALSDWKTTSASSPLLEPLTHGASSSVSGTPHSLPPSLVLVEDIKKLQIVDKLLLCEDIHLTASTSQSPVPSSISCHSRVSPALLHQHQHKNSTFPTEESPPKLKPCDSSPLQHERSILCNLTKEHSAEMDFCECRLPPVLSPITSPQCRLRRRSLSCQSSRSSEDEEMIGKDANRTKASLDCPVVQIIGGSNKTSEDFLTHIPEEMDVVSSLTALTDSTVGRPQSTPNSNKYVSDQNKEDSLDGSHHEESNKSPVPLKPPSSDEEDDSSFEDEEEHRAETDGDCQPDVLDEFTAYERDILLVGVTQDDPELFQNVPKQSLLKLGPVRRAASLVKTPPKKVTFSARIDEAPSELTHR